MADPREILAAKKAEILKQAELAAAEIDRDLAEIERLTAKYDLVVKQGDETLLVAEMKTSGEQSATSKKHGSRWNPGSASNRARVESEAIIRALNRPVPLGELHEKIQKRGVFLGGKNPKWVLSAVLGRHEPLESTELGWWLKGVEPPTLRQVNFLDLVKSSRGGS